VIEERGVVVFNSFSHVNSNSLSPFYRREMSKNPKNIFLGDKFAQTKTQVSHFIVKTPDFRVRGNPVFFI
jgi:hypothetical protein